MCIEGPVGAGKSSFIAAIVAGINCLEGSICVQDLTSGKLRYYWCPKQNLKILFFKVLVTFLKHPGCNVVPYVIILFGVVYSMKNGIKLYYLPVL